MSSATTRIDVPTAEKTSIAVWTEGEGPAVVLVHGSMCDHTTFDALTAELRNDLTVYAVDRRGFGASQDSGQYSLEREFGDIASVVDSVADRTGGPVALFGHSWGASCAMGGAAMSRNVACLLLNEPSFGLKYPPGFIDNVEAQVAAGDAESALMSVLVDLVGMKEEQVAELRSSAVWPERLATAPTIAREAKIEATWKFQEGQFEAISAPTVFVVGSQSPSDLVEITQRLATGISGAQVHTLADRDHFAYKTHPLEVANVVRTFLRSAS